ncbi:MAG: TolC family protein, partial [Phycisphaerae bacterium]|nr:TolC family protein [Phycisphaerae bacterium]
VELSNIDNELLTLRQTQTTAVAMLNRLLDRSIDAPVPAPATVELKQVRLELEQLLTDASIHNPSMKKVRERIQGFRERLKLARLGRLPNLNLSANYVAVENRGLSPVANGDDQWWFGLGVNLPIWTGRLDAAEREANRGVLEGLSSLSAVRNRVAFRLQDALSKTETDQQLVILFRDVIVPQARQTVDASLSGYRANRVDFLTLIDNWRKLLGFELMYHRNIARLEQDFADLQAAVGRDVKRGGGPPVPAKNPNENQTEVRP